MKQKIIFLSFLAVSFAWAQEIPDAPTTPPAGTPSNKTVAPATTKATPAAPSDRSAFSQRGDAGNSPLFNLPGNLLPQGVPGSDSAASPLFSSLESQMQLLSMNGKMLSPEEIAMFRVRFEKYLNMPPADSSEDLEYNRLLLDIRQRLVGKGGGSTEQRIVDAWRMLYEVSKYPIDANMCETLGDKVISYWQTTDKISKLLLENEMLEADRRRKEAAITYVKGSDRKDFLELMRKNSEGGAGSPPTRDYEVDPVQKRLEETQKKLDQNKEYEITSRVNQRLDFQSLILQFFVQRRFYHTLIANDFYRYLFEADDDKLEGAEALRTQVFGNLDVKLTTATIDALSKEAINEATESMKAAEYLISQKEIHTAMQRLMAGFLIGEYLAPVKTFPLESKRKILEYMRDVEKLQNAVKVKHVERAEEILKKIESYVSDFDSGQVESFVRTSRQLSDLSVQKALVAMQAGNQAGIEEALAQAVEYWPTNPKIQQFLTTVLGKSDLKDMATTDFDRLVKQKDYRAIFNDRFRFAAALAADDQRNAEFLEIMKRMEVIETALSQARELSRLENNYGAWEVLEKVYRLYPEDMDLNRMRSDFAVKVPNFGQAIAEAEAAVRQGDRWKAMICYLRAKEMYPMSSFASDEIPVCAEAVLIRRIPIGQ